MYYCDVHVIYISSSNSMLCSLTCDTQSTHLITRTTCEKREKWRGQRKKKKKKKKREQKRKRVTTSNDTSHRDNRSGKQNKVITRTTYDDKRQRRQRPTTRKATHETTIREKMRIPEKRRQQATKRPRRGRSGGYPKWCNNDINGSRRQRPMTKTV